MKGANRQVSRETPSAQCCSTDPFSIISDTSQHRLLSDSRRVNGLGAVTFSCGCFGADPAARVFPYFFGSSWEHKGAQGRSTYYGLIKSPPSLSRGQAVAYLLAEVFHSDSETAWMRMGTHGDRF